MQSIGIFTAPYKSSALNLTRQLVALADQYGVKARLQFAAAAAMDRKELGRPDEEVASADALITLSGDGGVLTAARAAAPFETPILAVNLGRLGFLSAIPPSDIARAFPMLIGGEFVSESRLMLEATLLRRRHNGDPADRVEVGGSLGLNDAVVAKSALARILRLTIEINGDLVAEMRADGLVIATATGSTAYALAAGGPIVHPSVGSLLICPICAHSLTQRPLVVGHDETIEVHAEWEGDEVASSELETMLTIDGQIGFSLQSGDLVRVRRSPSVARLLRLPDESFYDRLREKMRWGR